MWRTSCERSFCSGDNCINGEKIGVRKPLRNLTGRWSIRGSMKRYNIFALIAWIGLVKRSHNLAKLLMYLIVKTLSLVNKNIFQRWPTRRPISYRFLVVPKRAVFRTRVSKLIIIVIIIIAIRTISVFIFAKIISTKKNRISIT